MKFNFKIQQYQTDAVEAVVQVFAGQGYHDKIRYIRDLGRKRSDPVYQTMLAGSDEDPELADPLNDTGYKNEAVALTDEQLFGQYPENPESEQHQTLPGAGEGAGTLQPGYRDGNRYR